MLRQADRDNVLYVYVPEVTGDLDMVLSRLVTSEVGGETNLSLDFVSASTSQDDNESILARVFKGETYVIEMFGFNQATLGAYRFDVAFGALFVPGDYDRNGFVGDEDRALWADFYGADVTTTPEAAAVDGNFDGVIDAGDYTYWRDRQGNGSQPPFGSSALASQPLKVVPTPAASLAAPLAAFAVPTPSVSTPRLDEDATPGVAVSPVTDELALLLLEETVTADAEPLDGPSAEADDEPREDAFADLEFSFGLLD